MKGTWLISNYFLNDFQSSMIITVQEISGRGGGGGAHTSFWDFFCCPLACKGVNNFNAILVTPTTPPTSSLLFLSLFPSLPTSVISPSPLGLFFAPPSSLRKYFNQSSKMKYLQSLVQIPTLDAEPPSFLLPGKMVEQELAKQVRLAPMQREVDSITSFGTLVEPVEVEASPTPKPKPKVQTQTSSSVFDTHFGSNMPNEEFDFVSPQGPIKCGDEK